MWKMIVLLWLIPLVLGIVVLARIGRGERALRREEWKFLFGDSKEAQLSIWLGIKLAVLSVLLFFAGVFQGLVVVNLGFLWTMLVSFATALGLILILALWLRSASSEESGPDPDEAHSESHKTGTPAHRLDGFEL
jgi:hypothetical protein